MSRSPATIRAEAQTIAKQATEKSLPDNQLIQQLCALVDDLAAHIAKIEHQVEAEKRPRLI